jgi:D-glycero-alpha-D-manno-heptose 1-phosphate guanylyltransferase
MEAIILAGGLGKRLRSVVADVPKPMAPVLGKPFLEYQLAYWHAQGVKRFILSVGYKWNIIQDHFGAEFKDAEIDYCVEPEPLGTGGGFLLSLEKLKTEDPFLLLNGDTIFKVRLADLASFHQKKAAEMTLALAEVRDNDRYSGIDLASDGRITAFGRRDKARGGSAAVNGGIYLMDPAAFGSIEWNGSDPISLEDQICPQLLADGRKIFKLVSNAPFINIGVPESYRLAEKIIT